jgi:hypothetical protein
MPTARYRAVITGFRCLSPTWDHVLQVDGKDDEVYLSTLVTQMNGAGQKVYEDQPTSLTMGDVNGQPGRIRAGTASRQGGIRANDTFPDATPWIPNEPPSPDRRYPPMTVWENDLTQGQDVVLIAPALWEYDGGKDAWGDWVAWGQQTLSSVGPKLLALIGEKSKVIFEAAEIALGVAVSMTKAGLVGQASDRPIGMQPDGSGYTFTPKVVALNYDSAAVIANSGNGGVLELPFVDAAELRGHYSVFLRVEKVSETPPPPSGPPLVGYRGLRAANGQYVCAEGGGGREVVANRDQLLGWETFGWYDLGGGRVALQAANGQFVCAEGGGGREVVANRDQILGWETFEAIDLGGGRVALRAANGQYMCAEGAGGREVVANRDQALGWETFDLITLG